MAVDPAKAPAALHEMARQLSWWKTPAEARATPQHFVAQVMTLGKWEDGTS